MSGNDNQKIPGGSRKRRRILQGSIAVGGLGIAGLGGLGIASAREDDVPSASEDATAFQSTHPGMLHTQADLDRMAGKVADGAEPWIWGWDKLVANDHSQSGWVPRPVEEVVRGSTDKPENYPLLYNDIHAAYQNALRWRITGDTAHGDTARDICNAWSQTLESIYWPPSDSRLASGIYGYQFANVAELIRDYDGFDLGRFQQMMMDVFYPLNSDFLVRHNDTCDSHYWANWDLCNMASIIAIGILCDDDSLFDEAIDYFWNGAGNGAIGNAIPFVHDGLAQWQESGRDQAHSMMGIGLMAAFMEMAWNQGVDLYSANDNAFAKAAEYVARYNLGDDVPFTTYSWGFGHNCDYREHTAISDASRGQVRPVWEMVYGHYTQRQGFAMPNVAQMAGQNSPEGGGGDYGSTSGGFDALGFGTLSHVRLHWNDIPADLTPL
ncbi:alginate lyase family protein [Glycomyces salinus]|uniref:alginate lyase family protein n=1 Tax=Glycomyces salinus TaxID=980294 RepID=UPI0018EA81CF|nr:alginate lyase family protein [Glycomyces salinus]